MRDTTERPEGVEAGTCELIGTDPKKICTAARVLLEEGLNMSGEANLKIPMVMAKRQSELEQFLKLRYK